MKCGTERNLLFLQLSRLFRSDKTVRNRFWKPQRTATGIRYALNAEILLQKLYFAFDIWFGLKNYCSGELWEYSSSQCFVLFAFRDFWAFRIVSVVYSLKFLSHKRKWAWLVLHFLKWCAVFKNRIWKKFPGQQLIK